VAPVTRAPARAPKLLRGELSDDARVDSLDGLRGIAAIAVMLFHYLFRGPGLYPQLGISYRWAEYGAYGVNLFFIVSGFVIFMSIRQSSFRRFATARLIRLFPLYWLCVILTFAFTTAAGLPGRTVTLGEAAVNLTMLQGYLGVPEVDGVYWTLAVELAFYAQCGLLLLAGLVYDRALDFVLPVWLGLAALTLLPHSSGGIPVLAELQFAIGWLPLFIIGVALYCAWRGDVRFRRLVLIPLALGIRTLHDPVEGAVTLVLVALAVLALSSPRWGFGAPVLRWLGLISYALYLLHQNLGYVALRAVTPWIGQRWSVVLVGAGALMLASLATFAFDVPVRRRLRRALMRRTPGVGYTRT